MHLRSIFVLATTAAALAVPAAVAAPGGAVESASGGVHWTIPLPNAFGVEVINQPLAFDARKYADGSVSGRFEYHQIAEGTSFNFNVEVTCMNVYGGNRAQDRRCGQAEQRPDDTRRHVRVVPGLRQRRGGQRARRSVESRRVRRRGRERGVLQQPEPPPLRTWDVQGNVQVRG